MTVSVCCLRSIAGYDVLVPTWGTILGTLYFVSLAGKDTPTIVLKRTFSLILWLFILSYLDPQRGILCRVQRCKMCCLSIRTYHSADEFATRKRTFPYLWSA